MQVNDIHVAGKPDVFKPGFPEELRNHIHTIWNDPEQSIAVAEEKTGRFAVLPYCITLTGRKARS